MDALGKLLRSMIWDDIDGRREQNNQIIGGDLIDTFTNVIILSAI